LEQQLGAPELGLGRRLDCAGAHPPRRVDLVPAVLRVGDPGADDLDARPLRGHGDARAVVRDDLDDEVAADAAVAVREQVLVAGIRPQVDVDIAVVRLEHHVGDRADRDPAAALDLQPLRVVDAGHGTAAAAVGRGRRRGPAQAAGGDVEEEENAENRRRPPHRPSVPAASRRRKSLLRTCQSAEADSALFHAEPLAKVRSGSLRSVELSTPRSRRSSASASSAKTTPARLT
jgi:hypothetical protein